MRDIGRILLITGIALVVVGALMTFLGARVGRLPGDLTFRRGSFTFYFPLMTSLLLSLLLTLILWLFRR